MKQKTFIMAKHILLLVLMAFLPALSIAQSSHVTILPGIAADSTIVREAQDLYILCTYDNTMLQSDFYVIKKPAYGSAYSSFPLLPNFMVRDFTIYNDEVFFVGEMVPLGLAGVGVFSISDALGTNLMVNYYPFPTLNTVIPTEPTATHQLTFNKFNRIRYFKDGIRGHLMLVGNMNDLINNTIPDTARCVIDCDFGAQTFEFAFNYLNDEYFDDIIAMQDYVVLLARKGGPSNYLAEPIMRMFRRLPFSLTDLTGEWTNMQMNNLCRNRIMATLMEKNNFMTAYYTYVSGGMPYEGLVLNTYNVGTGTIIPQQSVYLDQGGTISSTCEIRGICYDSVDSSTAVLQRMDLPLFPTTETAVCKFLFQNNPISTNASFTYGNDLQSMSLINSNLSVCSGTISGRLGLSVEKISATMLCTDSLSFSTTFSTGGNLFTEHCPLYINAGTFVPLSVPVATVSSLGQIPCINW